MSYTPVNWEDSPSTSTPITADNLNIMDKGIADVDERTTEIETNLPKKIDNENNAIRTNHISDGAITQAKIAEDLLKLILAGGGSGSGITYEQVKVLMETKEDTANKVTIFDQLFSNKEKYPTVMAVINYLKEFYYDYNDIDEMLADLGGGAITEEDLAELKAELKAELSQLEPNFVNSIEECTDTSKVYVLPDGYIYAYMNVSGYDNKDIMPVSETEQTKNGLTFTTDGNGSYILNGTATASAVYKIYESNTSLPEDFEIGKKYKLILKSGYIGTTSIMINYGNGFESFEAIENSESYCEFTIPDNAVGMQIKFYPATNYEYTDEVVRYECYRYIDGYAYANTGHAFIPADYEDRIIALEKEVQPKATTSKPMLTIIDDDGYKKFTTLLLPIIQDKGVPISTAVVVGRANGEDEESVTEKVMNWEEIENAYLAGAEILSHTYWHLSQAKVETMTNTQIQYDYQRAQNTLRSHGIKSEGLVFAGASCNLEKCQTACANVYQYAFKSYGDVINKKGNTKPYQIDRYKIEPTGLLNETDLKSLIDTLVSDGTGWMVWMIHTSDSGFQQEQANVISTVIDYAIEQGVEIVTAECGARNYV